MPCLCVVLVGSDLMHLLGWVSIHDTHHHMGVFEKKFVVGIFGVWIFGLLQSGSQRSYACDGLGGDAAVVAHELGKGTAAMTTVG